ncbi:hypothetical protein HZA76_02430 [Candidatus Roizmanbacteria bacterium]|nr:hypothetical protein [Candidatus Roizmanbacteria bacterium]
MEDKITYRNLLMKMKKIKKNLIKLKHWKNSARFDLNINLLEELTLSFENNSLPYFLNQKNKNGECIFMLKEVREFVSVFEILFLYFEKLDKESTQELNNKIEHILSGPQFTSKETFINSKSRDYLFEIVMAAEFFKLGAEIQFRVHPDVLLKTANDYMVECKRILFGDNEFKRLTGLSLEACKQLFNSKKNTGIKMGIIALDISSIFEQGRFLLKAKNEREVFYRVQTDMQNLHVILLHNNRILDYANRGLLTASVLYTSVVTDIGNKELSWANQKSILAFSGQNPNRARKFLNDFYKQSNADDLDKVLTY